MFLTKVLLVFCAVKLTIHQQLNCTNVDLKGLHYELLLTHLTEIESRIQTTLQEIAQNQSRQLEELKLRASACGSPSLALDTTGRINTLLPGHDQIHFHRETISGIGTDRTVGGEWVLFQWRFNGSLLFNRTWSEYRAGFGDTEGEHWLGLDNLHQMLSKGRHELLVVMENFNGTTAYAHYDMFSIGTELERYAIKTIGKYRGTAGDSLSYHIGSKFTTYDQDNDVHASNCASIYNGGWWFKDCHSCYLNGDYVQPSQNTNIERGLIWMSFTGPFRPLKSSKMMVRQQSSKNED
ncbi:microfibril-associated glycoprotein 4-like [Anopheles marshallii]|uniref:microfibril-associated glycoprotein 4-like n=1 Tax=Anopheles marshallii TaxID=1521116 RepID=UPI00237B0397|nr:microfibril-associated glycoprotein 4-like [Anopheles marshallii]